MFGGVDPAQAALTGPAVYTPMTAPAGSLYYDVAMDDLGFGDTSLGFGSADFGTVTVDTGTSVLALPSAVFVGLENAIQALPVFSTAFGNHFDWFGTTDCFTSTLSRADMDAQFPPLTLTFPGVSGGQIVVTMQATKSYLPPTTSNGTTYYCSGIWPFGMGTVLGSSAMLGQMVIVDLDANRVGFAPQSFCP
jgi:hypothetical protein